MRPWRLLVFVCTLVIAIGATLIFDQQRIGRIRRHDLEDSLRSEWQTARLMIRIENGRPIWYVDYYDPSQARLVDRVQKVYLLTRDGDVLERSTAFDGLPLPPAVSGSEMRIWQASKKSLWGTDRYLLCTGAIRDVSGAHYQMTVGRPID